VPVESVPFVAHNHRVDVVTWHKVLNPILKGKERAMIKTAFEDTFDEGVAVGEERGEVKWKADMVLKALRKKFGKTPKGIEKAILAMTDPIALESLLEHVFDCKTLDEFATML
jgi:hypothetical protein